MAFSKSLRLGASTWAYLQTCSLPDALDRLHVAGFDRFDVLTVPPHIWPFDLPADKRGALRRALSQKGLTVESLNLPSTDQNLCSATIEMRDYSVGQWHAVMDLCEDLGVPSVVMVPGRRPSFVPPPDRLCDGWLRAALDKLVPHAERAGVTIMLENHHLSPMPSVKRMAGFLAEYGSPSLGIAYDVANGEFVGEGQADAIRAAGPWLRQVHLSDASAIKWDHAPVGRASIDFGAVGRALLDAGFSGTSIVELVSDTPDEDMHAARAHLEPLGWEKAER